MAMTEERKPPEGKIWRCAQCGKMAEDLYGIEGWHSYGYDVSCMLNAKLVDDPRIQNTEA